MGELSTFVVGGPDPESIQKKRRSSSINPRSSKRNSEPKEIARLRKLGTTLLDTSGILSWRPWYRGKRNIRQVNGLICSALNTLLIDEANEYTGWLKKSNSPSIIGPWSITAQPNLQAARVMAFGSVVSISAAAPNGSRSLVLDNNRRTPLIVAEQILERASRSRQCPLDEGMLKHPLWVLFIAELFAGVWKAHLLVGFRLSSVGLIPVESDPEEMMVARLIKENRHFRRLLLPPESKCKMIPDFQIEDTVSKPYLEVAGLRDDAYLAGLAKKRKRWRNRLSVWHTHTPLNAFTLP